ncbi:receptor-like cytosolic serine/threonine-protein kinase RBK2 [Brassica rapa]|uniref:non-specific serine/threonine protein kinase n=1 Tax=Brassica campestris TaxID=3711 RepID=M4FED7_BRACM|nr:receptor-like cytosolic serine/threonine-protein kinase RBK2 [Brassica rapa]XP_033147782.1 receptor-like cytosolic serine/threonine-protein kinase RBK2 [Brassica rapa]
MVVDKSSEASPLCCALPMYSPKYSSYVTEEDSNDLNHTPKHKRTNALLTNSDSVHDLRCQEVEKEKQDTNSPRGALEACLTRCSISSTSSSLDDPPSNREAVENADAEARIKNHRASSNWGKFFKHWKRKSMKRLSSFPPLAHRRNKNADTHVDGLNVHDIYDFQSSLHSFSITDLEIATDNFSPENIIGRGGYAEVYQGILPEGKLIAVKRLIKGTPDEKTAEFLSELGIIAHVDHPNTAKFIGCCIDGGMHLVFWLSPLGSLGSLLHGPSKDKLTWNRRYKVALGTADGLMYLHEGCQRRIIHRDIKADNILLTEDFQPQICDFGLAKWLPKQLTHHNVSKFEGTFGYFAPEYFMHGIVDEKTDVFAFGVLLLELITGHPALDDSQQSLVLWAKPLLEKKEITQLVDSSLGDEYNVEELSRLTSTASLCIEQSSLLRPRMSQVVELLLGQGGVDMTLREDKRNMMQRTYSEDLLDSIEYNSTKYLGDLDHIREVALAS